MRVGSLHSSAMLTESSKPTMAKNASVVAAITGQSMLPVPEVLNSRTRETSPCAGSDRPQADEDDDQETRQLDAGEDDIRLHALADAAKIDQPRPTAMNSQPDAA